MRLLVLLPPLIAVSSFSISRPIVVVPCRRKCSSSSSFSRLFGTKEEEIARLEAQIRQLREEEEGKVNSDASSIDDKLTVEEFEVAKRRLEKMKGKDMLLTEEYLIGDGLMETEGKGINVLGIVGAVAALVLVVAFAQVPIGQESLARYSATGSSAVKTIDLGDMNPYVKQP